MNSLKSFQGAFLATAIETVSTPIPAMGSKAV
jgi:hypothetical protein